MLSCTSLTEKGVEGIITTTNGFITWHLTIRLDSMFKTVQLPASISYLYTSLSNVDRDTLTLKEEKFKNEISGLIRNWFGNNFVLTKNKWFPWLYLGRLLMASCVLFKFIVEKFFLLEIEWMQMAKDEFGLWEIIFSGNQNFVFMQGKQAFQKRIFLWQHGAKTTPPRRNTFNTNSCVKLHKIPKNSNEFKYEIYFA